VVVDAVQSPVRRGGSEVVVVVVGVVAPSQANKCRRRRSKVSEEDRIKAHSLEALPHIQRENKPMKVES
jgi:hypothetical protein